MSDGPDIARVAAAIGDHARAQVLASLLADRALTASELAAIAGVGKATISSHLSRLVDVGLVLVQKQGRHRYFCLADADVARLLESLMGVAVRAGALRLLPGPKDPALRRARVCYDHLAGEIGVTLYDGLLRGKFLRRRGEAIELTRTGRDWFEEFGIDTNALARQRRVLCRPCLDWSERRMHLAGGLGKAMLDRIEAMGWAKRSRSSRIVTVTPSGERALKSLIPSNRISTTREALRIPA
jgi:DNA-binding transcriptional ArsR family regulator